MISFQHGLNRIDVAYMQKQYGALYNAKTIAKLSTFQIRKLLANEGPKLALGYHMHLINEYINEHYEHTVRFLNTLKRLLRKASIQLYDLNAQELLLLEERVFSANRTIKTLATNFPTHKNERVGIKFLRAHLFQVHTPHLVLLTSAELLISNRRIILNGKQQFAFSWASIRAFNYRPDGFAFKVQQKHFLISIHDDIALNSTIKNYLARINFRDKRIPTYRK